MNKSELLTDNRLQTGSAGFVLGNLCKRGHDHKGTGRSLRYASRKDCVACKLEREATRYRDNWQEHIDYQREYDRQNSDKIRQYRSQWLQADSGRQASRQWTAKRQEALKSVQRVKYSRQELLRHLSQFGGKCAYCHQSLKSPSHKDHFLPISRGGSDCLGNIVSCCRNCNSSKQDKDPYQWYKTRSFYSRNRWEAILGSLGKTQDNYNTIPFF